MARSIYVPAATRKAISNLVKLTKVKGATEKLDVWWDEPKGPVVSCPKCGFMTTSMNPQYTEYVTVKGGSFTCPECKKTTEIELVN